MPDPPETSNASNGTSDHSHKRFELPAYTHGNPDLWFCTCEIIFDDYAVRSEKQRFSAILQRLGTEQINVIESIIRHKPDNPYTQAKARLIAADGQSEEEKLNQLLRGADITPGTKPCVILQKLRALAGPEPEADKIVRPIWLQKLPIRTQEVLSANRTDPLDTICKTADRLHELAESSSAHVHALNQQPTASNGMDECLATVLRLLTSEISALRADRREFREHRSRDRSRDHSRDRNRQRFPSRPRARSVTPGRDLRTEMIDGQCWYHHTYGDRARNCAPGCRRALQGNAE